MDAVLLTWRWQNIFAIWVIVLVLFFLLTLGNQAMLRMEGNKAAKNG